MPIKRIQFPDGSIKRVEVPEGATNDQIMAFVQSSYKPRADFGAVTGTSSGVPRAMGQARQFARGDSALQRFGYGVASPIADAIVGVSEMTGIGSKQWQDETKARIDAVRATPAGKVGTVAGEIGMLAVPAAKAGKLASLGGRVAGNAGLGAVAGGLRGVREGETRGGNIGLGALLGGGGGVAGEGLTALGGRAARAITPEARALLEKAKQAGIRVTPAQISTNPVLRAARSTVSRMPFTGAGRVAGQQREQFNRAVSRTFGEDAPAITPEVYAAAKQRIGGTFNELTERNTLRVDDDLMDALGRVERDVAETHSPETIGAVRGQIDKLLAASDNGLIPGRAYQSFDSAIGKLMKSGGEKANYLGGVREAARDGMDRSISATDSAAWSAARGQYRNLKTIRDLVARENGEGISPAALMGRVNANGAGKESMAMGGGGELGDLARIGQRFLKDTTPNSGTPERLAWLSALGGGGTLLGGPQGAAIALGTSPLARLLMDSPALASYMLRQNPGLLRGQVGKALPYLGFGGIPAVAQAKQSDDPSNRP